MQLPPFTVGQLPRIIFGEGEIAQLPSLIAEQGRRVLLVTGCGSFVATEQWPALQRGLGELQIGWEHVTVSGEPSPQLVDDIVARFHGRGIEVVVGVGGGSVLDAAKAIAGLLPFGNSVLDHLEDVGRGLTYHGPALPLIAVPTTAGTGSEATKNAVLSAHGENGYKKSFRHESLVARVALVDPGLLQSCPPTLVASHGMDAFTQLLESYLSIRANPFTDALAWSGLEAVAAGFMAAYRGGDSDAAREGRAAMSYGALLSGITLAQVGLGSVHGLAQPLGSLFPVPHGVACGATVAEATAINITALRERNPEGAGLEKYRRVGYLLGNGRGDEDTLVEILRQWTRELHLPRLSSFGIGEGDVPAIVAASRNNSMKGNPLYLTDDEIAAIVRRCL